MARGKPKCSASPSKSASGYSNDSSESAQLSPRLLFSDFQFHVIDHQPRRDFFQRIGGDAELVSRGVRQLNGKVKRTGAGMRYAIVFRDTFLRINTGTADSVPASLNQPFAPSRAFADSARPLQKTLAQRA